MDGGEALKLDSGEPLPRETLGGFQLAHKMAAGGMATVYLGHRLGPGGDTQVAAIKVMFPHLLCDAEYVEMFFDEARLTSSINHPNVCSVLDYGVEEGFHYLATEYVLGETWGDLVEVLHQRPEGKAVAQQLLSHIVAQACEGLHAVHETHDARGQHLAIVHRDISPQNIMIGYDGIVRLLDFGIASAKERLHETRNGVVKGHVGYMAPEQVQMETIDRRCDLWPLGVMLWEGVTGRRLFKRPDPQATMYAITSEPLGPLLREGQALHPAVLSVVERSMMRDPRARFATAHDMGTELSKLPLGTTTMSPAQVASWMRHLFAERFEDKRTQLRDALGHSAEHVEGSRSGVRLSNNTTTVSGIRSTHLGAAIPTRIVGAASSARTAYLTVRARLSPRLRPSLPGALLSLLLLAVLGVGVLGASKARPTGPEKQVSSAAGTPSVAPAAVHPATSLNTGQTSVGILDVRSHGLEARVELEGKELGTTPLRIELPTGRHLFRIVPANGEAAAHAQVIIEAGEHYVMDIERDDSPAHVAH